ncbi:formyltransferase family protein [Streptomyces sp. NPDC051582]|uniref:formyltransferase family protein n=1 Tax=Streptomyces sp. NPDC051582 TaxID=3155167 RepID=UPI00342668EC
MIFVGDGALLRRAVAHAAAQGHPVDLVCSADPQDATGGAAPPHLPAPHLPAPHRPAPYLPAPPHLHLPAHADVNAHADALADACTDGIVWSLNNLRIFRAPLLSRGLRILNIHNGLLPRHRGLPSVAVLFALLNGEREYGATLHEVDAGIDTGRVLAVHRFPVAPDARHFQVMLHGVRACQALFEETLPTVAAGVPLPPPPAPAGPSAYHGTRALGSLAAHRDHPSYERATDLGPFAAHAPELAAAIATVTGSHAARCP